jgi:hypothetical protein
MPPTIELSPQDSQKFGVFISHITEEAHLALKIKRHLQDALKARVFVSADDIRLGDDWKASLRTALDEAKVMVVLCSQRSIMRPWINFESGSGWLRKVPAVMILHSGLQKADLPEPLSTFQVLELEDAADCETLVSQIGKQLDLEPADSYDYEEMARSLFVLPQRRPEIGVVLTHNQSKWEEDVYNIFDLPKALPAEIQGQWSVSPIRKMDALLSVKLHQYSGLIVGSPWRRRMAPGVVTALSDFVMQGGRMLLLGFEMGDRHHNANLNDLAAEFGLYFEADIVGPPEQNDAKPYDIVIKFDVSRAEPHPLTAGLSAIRLANVQTIRVLPLGKEWLRIGQNTECRPSPLNLEYRDRAFTEPTREKLVVPNNRAGWLPVAVEAPAGLCGKGAVHAIGTWDLLGRKSAFNHRENFVLLGRIFEWLSGREITDSFQLSLT